MAKTSSFVDVFKSQFLCWCYQKPVPLSMLSKTSSYVDVIKNQFLCWCYQKPVPLSMLSKTSSFVDITKSQFLCWCYQKPVPLLMLPKTSSFDDVTKNQFLCWCYQKEPSYGNKNNSFNSTYYNGLFQILILNCSGRKCGRRRLRRERIKYLGRNTGHNFINHSLF